MRLVELVSAAHLAAQAVRSTRAVDEPWLHDEELFFQHFGSTYDDFWDVVQHLNQDQQDRLWLTMEVNPEAAIIWILSMDVCCG